MWQSYKHTDTHKHACASGTSSLLTQSSRHKKTAHPTQAHAACSRIVQRRTWSGCIAATSEHSRSTRHTVSAAPVSTVARSGRHSGLGRGLGRRSAGSAAPSAVRSQGASPAPALPHAPCSCGGFGLPGPACARPAIGAREDTLHWFLKASCASAPDGHAAAVPAIHVAPALQLAPAACSCGALASTTLPACPKPAAAVGPAHMRPISAQARALADAGASSAGPPGGCGRLCGLAAAQLEAAGVALLGSGCSSPLSGAQVLPRSWPRATCCHLRTASLSTK